MRNVHHIIANIDAIPKKSYLKSLLYHACICCINEYNKQYINYLTCALNVENYS